MSEQALQRYSHAVRHMEPAGVIALAKSHTELIKALEAEALRLLRMQSSLMATSEAALTEARKL